MLRPIPNWVLWALILLAALASPFAAMLLLLLSGELLWNAVSAIGIPASLGFCAAAAAALLIRKLRAARTEAAAS